MHPTIAAPPPAPVATNTHRDQPARSDSDLPGPGVAVGPFTLAQRIGVGGMGEVWAAEHRSAGVRVAIKFVRPRLLERPAVLASWVREVRAVAALDHPYIARVYDTGTLGAVPWLAMELIPGRSLEDAELDSPSLQLPRVLDALLQALAHAHARGVLHRDIKPANVLVNVRDGRLTQVKLTDFGLAYALSDMDAARQLSGTPHFMAPEQFSASWRDFGPWTDVYALGILAWTLACGRPPFDVGDRTGMEAVRYLARAHLELPLPRAPIQPGLAAWIDRCTAKRPADRFSGAPEALLALRQVAGTLPEVPVRKRASGWLWGVGRGLFSLRRVPVVGRKHELDAVERSLESVRVSGRPAALILRGPAGVGKSHLAQAACEAAAEAGHARSIVVRHEPDADFWAGPEQVLRQLLRCHGLDRRACRARVVEYLGADVEPQLVATLTALAAGEPDTVEAPERFAALRRLLAHGGRPVVVFADDVQWGVELLSLVGHTLRARTAEPVPVLFLLTAQDGALADAPVAHALVTELSGQPSCQQLRVPELRVQAHRELVGQLLGLDPSLAEAIADHTAGSPAFAVHLVRDLLANDDLVLDRGGFVHRAGVALRLPDNLHAVWESRIRQATAANDGHRALEAAAVLGRSFSEREWRALCDLAGLKVPTTLLHDAMEARLLEASASGFRFSHEIVRASLLRTADEVGRLRGHHALAADLVRAESLGRATDLERLGGHLLGAGRYDDGLQYLALAAQKHYDTGDAPAALVVNDRVRATLARARRDHPDLDVRHHQITAATLRVRCVVHCPELAPVEATIAELRGLMADDIAAGARLDAALAVANGLKWLGRYDEADVELCGVVRDSAPGSHAWRLGVRTRSDVAYWQGRFADAERLLASIDDADLPARFRLEMSQRRGDLAIERGDLDAARDHLHEAMLLVAETGATGVGISLRNSLADLEAAVGRPEVAHGLYLAALDDLRRIGSPFSAIVEVNLAAAALSMGRLDEARERLQAALPALARLEHARHAYLSGLCTGIEVEALRGDVGSATDLAATFERALRQDTLVPASARTQLAAAREALGAAAPALAMHLDALLATVQARATT